MFFPCHPLLPNVRNTHLFQYSSTIGRGECAVGARVDGVRGSGGSLGYHPGHPGTSARYPCSGRRGAPGLLVRDIRRDRKLLLTFTTLEYVVIVSWNITHGCMVYRPPAKFWEGNVFSRVCLSVCSQGVTYDHYTPLHPRHGSSLARHHPYPGHGTSLDRDPPSTSGHHWRPVQTC